MHTKQFQKIIWAHYKKNKKKNNFPWRKTRDPYHILVSEIMLQQTQISRVVPKYNKWLKTFPTIHALSRAPFSNVLRVWHGLGYNRRARYIKDTARIIVKQHKGKIPKNPRDLRDLPGIGTYTSRAVLCFAYGVCEPFLDTNIRRVYIFFFEGFIGKKARGYAEQTQNNAENKITDAQILSLIKKTEPKQNKREWYAALMDYGRNVLGKEKINPNRKSKTYVKQSPFLGSRRFVRANIITILLSSKKGKTKREIKTLLQKNIHARAFLAKTNLTSILQGLAKEKVITRTRHTWMLMNS